MLLALLLAPLAGRAEEWKGIWLLVDTVAHRIDVYRDYTPVARFYDIATATPIFGDRDRLVRTDVNTVSLERRKGYKWWGTGPAAVLARYYRWAKAHPLPQ